MDKVAILPKGNHLVVFLPTEDDKQITEMQAVESKCWLVTSYEEAVRLIEDFIMGEEYVCDLDSRFEIFDEFLEACGDQKVFEDLALRRWDLEMDNEEVVTITPQTPDHPSDVEEIEQLFGHDDIHVPAQQTQTKTDPPKMKEVKFDDIKVEDNRK